MGKICTFIGHSDVRLDEILKERLNKEIVQLIENGFTEFYCGGYGDFDNACAYTLRTLKNKYPDINIIYVTPYIGGNVKEKLDGIKSSGIYDEILYPGIEDTLPRFAISKRNEFMVDAADAIIAYIDHDWGGAYTTYSYAKRNSKSVLNLCSGFTS